MVEVLAEVHPAPLLVLEVRIRPDLVLEVRILLPALDLAEVRMAEFHLALARILVRILEAFQVIVYMDT
jgi:hypothetical protein